MSSEENERLRRWRLVLGSAGGQGLGMDSRTGRHGGGLATADVRIDEALEALYEDGRKGGLGPSAPSVPRWLQDIRNYFPASTVQVMQRDAIERLDLKQLLLEREMLDNIEPDVSLVAMLMALRGMMKRDVLDSARIVVAKVVEDLMKRLEEPMRQAVRGALNRASRNYRPRPGEIDWRRTIRDNLKHYQAEYKTIVPEKLVGFGRRRRGLRDLIMLIDQSGSMAQSVVYSSVFGAVMASIPAVRTRLAVFDTAIVDLTEMLADPVEILFSVQLGGGTDIDGAVAYGESLIGQPGDTIMVLISDLFEGGLAGKLEARAKRIMASGVQLIVLTALTDKGAPAYDRQLAARLATLGATVFACTPDIFPDLMAAAIRRDDLSRWAGEKGVPLAA